MAGGEADEDVCHFKTANSSRVGMEYVRRALGLGAQEDKGEELSRDEIIAVLEFLARSYDWYHCREVAVALALDFKAVVNTAYALWAADLLESAGDPSGRREDARFRASGRGRVFLEELNTQPQAPRKAEPEEPRMAAAVAVDDERFDVFVSYAGEDRDAFVSPLVEKLLSRGVKVWYDPKT